MTPTQLRDLFRSDVRDEVVPYLWSDTELFSYMDDAQKMFCRLTGGISDTASELCVLPYLAGATNVPLDPRILKLRNVADNATGRSIDVLNFEDLETTYRNGIVHDPLVGRVRAVVVGLDDDKLRLNHIPAEAGVLRLTVYRMPMEPIAADSDEFEIAEHHHRALLTWMKHLAYAKQDAETYDRGRSAEFSEAFLAHCDLAKSERSRREHKYRTVQYGGY